MIPRTPADGSRRYSVRERTWYASPRALGFLIHPEPTFERRLLQFVVLFTFSIVMAKTTGIPFAGLFLYGGSVLAAIFFVQLLAPCRRPDWTLDLKENVFVPR